MVEPIITTVGAALAVRWAGKKLLGPVCDEIGQGLAESYSQRRLRNLNRIGVNAQAKLGSAINTEGRVSPRVAWRVFEEGSWCDAAITAEYFAGILAASRSSDGADDRGVAWAGVVSRLATDDIYLHYLAYDAFRRLYAGERRELGNWQVRSKLRVYLPASELTAIIGPRDLDELAAAGVSLMRENLIENRFSSLDRATLRKDREIKKVPEDGVMITPSRAGIEFFLWAHGLRWGPSSDGVDTILDETIKLEAVEPLGSVTGARRAKVRSRLF